jgi:hypothetical protein
MKLFPSPVLFTTPTLHITTCESRASGCLNGSFAAAMALCQSLGTMLDRSTQRLAAFSRPWKSEDSSIRRLGNGIKDANNS